MVNVNADALGIIFPNSYDSLMPEMTMERSMASIPFASRYRLVDFVISNMVNGGIDNVSLIVKGIIIHCLTILALDVNGIWYVKMAD